MTSTPMACDCLWRTDPLPVPRQRPETGPDADYWRARSQAVLRDVEDHIEQSRRRHMPVLP